jgi:diamine N-acetyltransferase
MSDEVRLEAVTERNWRAVARLKLAPEQEHLVASNLYSIAQSKFDPNARPRAVCAGGTPIGFLMYDVWEAKDKTREASIYRFMIDRDYQGRGYGRAALVLALAEIKEVPAIKKVSIGYLPDNPVAKQFYASFGFVEVGKDEDGEIVAELKL